MNLRSVFDPALSASKVENECERFRCPECEQLHETTREAQLCCPPEVAAVYQCPHCESAWPSVTGVLACIERHPDASLGAYGLTAFCCPVCHHVADSIQDAVDCCLVLTHNHAQRWQIARDLEMGKVPV